MFDFHRAFPSQIEAKACDSVWIETEVKVLARTRFRVEDWLNKKRHGRFVMQSQHKRCRSPVGFD
jgi:hypothetical protein